MAKLGYRLLDSIGQDLVKDGLISADQLAVAMETKKNLGGDLGQILIRKGFVTDDQLLEFFGKRLNIPFISLADYSIDPDAVNLVPLAIAAKYHIMPLFKIEDTITIAMSDILDVFALDDIRDATHHRIQPVLASTEEIERLIETHYRADVREEKTAVPDLEVVQFGAEALEAPSEKLEEMASGAKVIKEVNHLITSAVNENASDIHIEPMEKTLRIRNRVDGVLEEWLTMPRQMHLPIVTRIKILSDMDIAERRLPQDGRLRIRVKGRVIDMRVSTYPTMYGEKVVIRLLTQRDVMSLEEIGMVARDLTVFERIIARPYGIFFVTGPTGSGKTTTLYAALSRLNAQERNIISIEDPIENEIVGVAQAQVNLKAGLTFATALRHILRQDPDIIMIGEIRDNETADIAVRSAITGHLVFSTLHTNSAVGAVTRMVDLGIQRFLISSSMLGVMAQRLVRKICPECKEQVDVERGLREGLGIPTDAPLYRGKGCKSCRMTGYIGRLGIFEMIEMQGKLRDMIVDGANESAIREEASRRGMSTLRQEAISRALEGMTTAEEVLRITAQDAD